MDACHVLLLFSLAPERLISNAMLLGGGTNELMEAGNSSLMLLTCYIVSVVGIRDGYAINLVPPM